MFSVPLLEESERQHLAGAAHLCAAALMGARAASLCRKVARAASRGALRKDVLVGFEPLSALLQELDARLGHCALFCVDELGGSVLGVKWKPKAWLPAPFRVATAHTSAPCVAGAAAGLFVTDVVAVVREILQVGEGMVADVVLCA